MENIKFKLNGWAANAAVLSDAFAELIGEVENCFILHLDDDLYLRILDQFKIDAGDDFYKDLYLMKKIIKIHDRTFDDWGGFSPGVKSLMFYDSFNEKYLQFFNADDLAKHLKNRYNIILNFYE